MLRVKKNFKEGKKNTCREKILIEKAKELTLSSKNESTQERTQYIKKMQEGGLPLFHGTSRYKRGGGGMFGMLAKSARSILPRVGKKYSNL